MVFFTTPFSDNNGDPMCKNWGLINVLGTLAGFDSRDGRETVGIAQKPERSLTWKIYQHHLKTSNHFQEKTHAIEMVMFVPLGILKYFTTI